MRCDATRCDAMRRFLSRVLRRRDEAEPQAEWDSQLPHRRAFYYAVVGGGIMAKSLFLLVFKSQKEGGKERGHI